MNQGSFAGAGDPAENSGAEREFAYPSAKRGKSGLGANFDVLGGVVHDADADVVEAESSFECRPTMSASICSASSLEIAVFEIVLTKANWRERRCSSAEKTGIFDGNRNLASRGLHDFQIALFEDVFPLGAHGDHHAGGLASEQDRRAAERLCRTPRK